MTATGGSIKNLSADNISATNFHMTSGTLTVGDNFKVTSDGKMTCKSANVTGNITGSTISSSSINCNDKFKVTSAGAITATSGTVGGFTLGSASFSGSTDKGTMTIKRGTNASIDFPANGGRLMLGSTAENGVALTTASTLVISDSYSHVSPGDNHASIGIRALNGNIRIASNHAIQLIPGGTGDTGLFINGHSTRTGQMSIVGRNSSGDFEYYVAFYNGLLVGVQKSGPFNTSTYPWLV